MQKILPSNAVALRECSPASLGACNGILVSGKRTCFFQFAHLLARLASQYQVCYQRWIIEAGHHSRLRTREGLKVSHRERALDCCGISCCFHSNLCM
eukprot:jgi/Botrbrau1/22407/Bobra.0091s0012.1